jgi:L-fucose isomerase
LINSGSATLDGTGRQTRDGRPVLKPFWEITQREVDDCLQATTWYPANREYFRGGGYSSKFVTLGGMPATMCRLNLIKGIGPVLQIAEGETLDLPAHVHKILDERTDKTWPTTWFVPRTNGQGSFRDVYSVMAAWGANHGAISYGHIGHDLITLASMLRIPVNMHNVEETRLFRPSAWTAFHSDHHACSTYGPLYK